MRIALNPFPKARPQVLTPVFPHLQVRVVRLGCIAAVYSFLTILPPCTLADLHPGVRGSLHLCLRGWLAGWLPFFLPFPSLPFLPFRSISSLPILPIPFLPFRSFPSFPFFPPALPSVLPSVLPSTLPSVLRSFVRSLAPKCNTTGP